MVLSPAERAKRYRDNIKKDQSRHNEYLKKERERYTKRKDEGEFDIKIKTPREQRRTRRKWRFNKKKERDEKIKNFKINQDGAPLQHTHFKGSNTQRQRGRKKVKANRSAVYRELEKAKDRLIVKQRAIDRYRKRIDRMKTKIAKSNEKANKKSRKETKLKNKTRLMVEVITKNMKERLLESQKERDRHSISRIVQLDFLKRYRLLERFSFMTGISTHRLRKLNKTEGYRKKSRSETWRATTIREIQAFLEMDISSTLAPGKKDTITRKGLKKQKRYLNDTLKNLHKKFMEIRGNVSYQTFCRYKPFWVVEKKTGDRDTCLCKLHENVKFMVNKLYKLKIIDTNNLDTICGMVTCDQRRKACMLRECNRCKNAEFEIAEFEDYGVGVEYFSWTTKTEIYEKDDKMARVQKVCKETVISTAEHLLNDALQLVRNKFCPHTFNIRQQFCSIKSLKENLNSNEMLLHMDFSENYQCKEESEIQSFHFGGSRNQVSLHTAVLYIGNNMETKSFCTISDGMEHNPSAIWSHIKPILQHVRQNYNEIDTIHFVSDGPTTQYRSRINFFLYHHLIHKSYGFGKSSWNFTEAGHGKGAADGIGAVVKRTADRLVKQGHDIPNAKTFYEKLLESDLRVTLYYIEKESFSNVSDIIPNNISGVKNTMKLHQIVSFDGDQGIFIRSLSCFCKWPGICNCFEFENSSYHIFPDHTPSNNGGENVASETTETSGGVLESSVIEPDPNLINRWCIIKYNDKGFPGIIQDLDSESAEVRCMCRIGRNRFFWPLVDDCIWYDWHKVLKLIPEPTKVTSRHWEIDPTIWREVTEQYDLNE